MAKLIFAVALVASNLSAFRAVRKVSMSSEVSGQPECCCKDHSKIGRSACTDKGYSWIHFAGWNGSWVTRVAVGGSYGCCTVKDKGCPRFSKYMKTDMHVCSRPEAIHNGAPARVTKKPAAPTNKGGDKKAAGGNKKAATDPTGMYIKYTELAHGTLSTTFETSKVSGAVAFVAPGSGVTIPAFKFGFSGRQQAKDTGDYSVMRYRNTIASFVKTGKQYKGTLFLDSKAPVNVALLGPGIKVTLVRPGQSASLSDKVAVAVVSKQSDAFTVSSLSRDLFYSTARSYSSAALGM